MAKANSYGLYAGIMLLSAGLVMPAAATSLDSSTNDLRQSVIALDRARHRSVHDLAMKRQQATLDVKQQQDYEKFIVFLTSKIGEYCQQLRNQASEAAVAGLQCPEEGQSTLATQPGSAQTSGEQVDDLERLLADSLGQFDDKLLKEEERLAGRQPRDRETGYGHGGSQARGSGDKTAGTGPTSGQEQGSSQTTGAEGTAGQGDSEKSDNRAAQPGSQKGGPAAETGGEAEHGTGEGAGSGEGAGQSAEGTGATEESAGSSSQTGPQELDTADDDIVARQLREAAEKETDPELKKKLWEEYRKYKEGVR